MTNPPIDFRDVGHRLDDIDRALVRVETMASVKADGATVAREIEVIRTDIRTVRGEVMNELGKMREATAAAVLRADNTANDVIRSGRSETLKLIIAAMTAFAVLLGGVVLAYASGRI
jgi:hypothetical protein